MTTLVPTKKKNSNGLGIFEDFFTDRFLDIPSFFAFANQNGSSIPQANIIENNADFEIEIAAPGLASKDFKAEIKNGVLNISAQKEEESEQEDKNFRKKKNFPLPPSAALLYCLKI